VTQTQTLTHIAKVLINVQKRIEALQAPAGGPIASLDEDKPLTLHQKAHDALVALKGTAATKNILQKVRKDYKTHSNYGRIYQALEYRKRKFGDVDRSNGVWAVKHSTH
jgi:hypothetical protein